MRNLSSQSRPRRRGAVLIYATIAMAAFLGFCSLAVDLGRVQMAKTEVQRSADATARGYLQLYLTYDKATADYYGPWIPGQTLNPVDSATVAPTVTATWGKWNAATKTFTATSSFGNAPAMQVTVSRLKANNKAIPLLWAGILGRDYQDLTHTAIANLTPASSVSFGIQGTFDPFLAGMPAGSRASYNDSAPANSPTQVNIPVIPGSYLTFTNITGAVRHGPTHGDDDPDGSTIYTHMMDSPDGNRDGAQNGFQTAIMPIDACLGVFLGDAAPNTTPKPAAPLDYSTEASRSQVSYDNIGLKQPFFIGDGKTGRGTGATQQFRVPLGATRFYLAVMDGYEWNNNSGSFTATVAVKARISMVK